MPRQIWMIVLAGALGVGLMFTPFVAATQITQAQEPPSQNAEQPQSPLGTVFTYQGQLKRDGAPITGNCSMAFRLYDQASNGNVIGNPIMTIVSIDNGLFTVQLDFGASAFAGEARWLGIQVQCPTDAAYVDLGRQALTAAPYAIYSTSTGALQGRSVASTAPGNGQVLKWNGSIWSPADDAIGPPGSGDISAVYAGSGLSGGGTTGDVTLTVAFAGSGTSTTAARSDHTHSGVYSLVGHTHPGSDITSAVANATNADLLDGQHASAFAGATHAHLGQTWTGSNNPLVITGTFGAPYYAPLVLRNIDAEGDGLRVDSASRSGVRVYWAGTDGVYVGQADNGVHVNHADFNGFSVYSATRAGVYVFSSGQDGVQVCTNIPGGGCTTSGGHHGVELDNIDDDGVHIGQAGDNGLYVGSAITGVHVYSATSGLIVDSAGRSGVSVERAGVIGMHVTEAGTAGVWVSHAGEYGVGVYKAGNPSSLSMSTFPSGFEVEGSEGYGLYVGQADMDGVYVFSADGDGVDVRLAGGDGVDATSTNASAYGGRFVNSATRGAGLYALGGSNTAADLILGGTSSTSDDGRIYSDPAYPGSDVLLVSNDAVQINLDSNNDESGNLWVINGAGTTVFAINENGGMTAIGTKNALVTTQDFGQRKLYAIESPQNWFEDFGSAQVVNGQATVPIEPIFAQTVNLTETYHVFLTPLGDCGLYVAAKTPASFIVKAMDGQTCSIGFDYRLVARRLGYEALRLEAATLAELGGEK